MAVHIVAPAVGWAAESSVYRWWQDDGDWVNPGTPLCTLSCGQTYVTICALESGFLRIADPQLRHAGTRLHRGTLLAAIVGPGESLQDVWIEASDALRAEVPCAGQGATLDAADWLYDAVREAAADKSAISPRARKTARALGLDPENLVGTGKAARIRYADVMAAAARSTQPPGPVLRPWTGQATDCEVLEFELQIGSGAFDAGDHWLSTFLEVLDGKLDEKTSRQPGKVGRWTGATWKWQEFKNLRVAIQTCRSLLGGKWPELAAGASETPTGWRVGDATWSICDLTETPLTRYVPSLRPGVHLAITQAEHGQTLPAFAHNESLPRKLRVTAVYSTGLTSVSWWMDYIAELRRKLDPAASAS